MISRQRYQKEVDVLYTDFNNLELVSRTTKAVVCMLGGSVHGCTNTTRLLVHTLYDNCVRLYRGGEGCEWKTARHDRSQVVLDLHVAVGLTVRTAEQ
jgi:hypothetical protein